MTGDFKMLAVWPSVAEGLPAAREIIYTLNVTNTSKKKNRSAGNPSAIDGQTANILNSGGSSAL